MAATAARHTSLIEKVSELYTLLTNIRPSPEVHIVDRGIVAKLDVIGP